MSDYTRWVWVHLDGLPYANVTLMRMHGQLGPQSGALVALGSIQQIIAADGKDVTTDLELKNKAVAVNAKYITLIVDA